MKKVIVEEAKFETVQTGTKEKEYFETTDGKRFTNEKDAEHHEFYNVKVNIRGNGIPSEVKILDCESKDDLNRYLKDYTYNVDIYNFEVNELVFPNTYVLWEHRVEGDHYGIDDDWYDYTDYIDAYTLKEWKEIMINQVNKLK